MTGDEFGSGTEARLPLNWVLTFFSQLANDVIANPHSEKVSQSFDMYGSLGNLANPKFATIFATNYSRYGSFENRLDGGRSATEEELHDAAIDSHRKSLFKISFQKI